MPQLVPGVPVSRKGAGGAASLGVFPESVVVPAWTGRVVMAAGMCARSRPGFSVTAVSASRAALTVDLKFEFFNLLRYGAD